MSISLSIMESDRLKQFCAVVETGSLTQAAESLGITLSGLSKSMKILQEQLNKELLLPRGRGILVTEDGRRVYQRAKLILVELGKLSATQSLNSFRIGYLEVFAYNLIGKLLSDSGPSISLATEFSPLALESHVLANDLDVGLTYLPFAVDGIEHIPFAKFSMGAFKLKNVFRGLPVREVPFVVPASGFDINPIGIRERDGWPEGLWNRTVALRTNLLSTAVDLACRGVGAIFIPNFVAVIHNQRCLPNSQLESLNLGSKGNFQRTLYLVKRIGSNEDDNMKKLTGAIRRILRDLE